MGCLASTCSEYLYNYECSEYDITVLKLCRFYKHFKVFMIYWYTPTVKLEWLLHTPFFVCKLIYLYISNTEITDGTGKSDLTYTLALSIPNVWNYITCMYDGFLAYQRMRIFVHLVSLFVSSTFTVKFSIIIKLFPDCPMACKFFFSLKPVQSCFHSHKHLKNKSKLSLNVTWIWWWTTGAKTQQMGL